MGVIARWKDEAGDRPVLPLTGAEGVRLIDEREVFGKVVVTP